jgi:hypothetical protein
MYLLFALRRFAKAYHKFFARRYNGKVIPDVENQQFLRYVHLFPF